MTRNMSAKAIIEGLKQGSDAELEFVKQLRKGLCTILNGMEVECYRRGDALGELEEDLQEDGHLRPSEEELRAEIHTLTNEREKLCQENKMWRLKVAELKSSQVKAALSAAPQNVCYPRIVSVCEIFTDPFVFGGSSNRTF